ncbi:tRNA pseudouridine(38-40) synthase TruA [Sulfurospirillum sp. 1307]|jgi:tRNA pseudouridine38-40 synthase
MKVKAILSYDGSKFHGFQIQSNTKVKTVVGDIKEALLKLNIQSNINGSGRTDSGVHATNQVIDFEVPNFWKDLKKLTNKLNQILSPFIYIKSIQQIHDNFNARFDAKKRLYRYILYTGKYQPFLHNYALHVKELDIKKLNKIVKNFIGEHDFKNFKKEGSPTNSDVRIIYRAGAYEHRGFFIIYFLGNGFLRSQVRMMSDFALKVMQGYLSEQNLKDQLACKKIYSRTLIAPNGLYLSKIYY